MLPALGLALILPSISIRAPTGRGDATYNLVPSRQFTSPSVQMRRLTSLLSPFCMPLLPLEYGLIAASLSGFCPLHTRTGHLNESRDRYSWNGNLCCIAITARGATHRVGTTAGGAQRWGSGRMLCAFFKSEYDRSQCREHEGKRTMRGVDGIGVDDRNSTLYSIFTDSLKNPVYSNTTPALPLR